MNDRPRSSRYAGSGLSSFSLPPVDAATFIARLSPMNCTEITIHADASWHASSQTAAWGSLLDGGCEVLPRSGLSPFYLASSTHAELYAVVAALDCAMGTYPFLERVTVKTDSDNVVMILNGEKRRLDDVARYLLDRIRVHNRTIHALWIKAHQDPSASGDAAANHRCDRLARFQLARGLTIKGVPRDVVDLDVQADTDQQVAA